MLLLAKLTETIFCRNENSRSLLRLFMFFQPFCTKLLNIDFFNISQLLLGSEPHMSTWNVCTDPPNRIKSYLEHYCAEKKLIKSSFFTISEKKNSNFDFFYYFFLNLIMFYGFPGAQKVMLKLFLTIWHIWVAHLVSKC